MRGFEVPRGELTCEVCLGVILKFFLYFSADLSPGRERRRHLTGKEGVEGCG